MEQNEYRAHLNERFGDVLRAMNEQKMHIAVELLDDIVCELMTDRERLLITHLKGVKKIKDAEDKIVEAEAKVAQLEASVRHPKGKK